MEIGRFKIKADADDNTHASTIFFKKKPGVIKSLSRYS